MNESTIHMTFKDINDSNLKKGLNNYISNEPENINNLENFTNSWSMINEVHNSNINTSNPIYFNKKPLNSINPTEKNYFNQNISPSDLDGSLKGNVFFAQSSIIPAKNNIEGDIQPNLVTGRKTLLLFKPHEITQDNTEVKLNIYDDKNHLIFSDMLSPPSLLPKIAGIEPYYTNILPENFDKPILSDLIITNKNLLEKIIINKSKLKEIIKNNNTDITEIFFSDIKLKKPFVLNSDPELSNKLVALTSHIDESIEINYGIKKVLLLPNETIHFICDSSGQWVTHEDALLSKQYFPSLLVNSKLSTEPSLNINEKSEIKKISKNKYYLNYLISENDTIKISIDNCNWVKNINLTPNTDFISKRIIFTSESQCVSEIFYDNKVIQLKDGDEILLECDSNGKWLKIEPNTNNSFINLNLTQPESFDLILDTDEEIKKFANNNDFSIELLNENDTIKIATSNYNWAESFSLTENEKFHNKKILFTSTAAYSSTIKYGNKNISLKRDESILFIYDHFNKWMTIDEHTSHNEIKNLHYIENGWSIPLPGDVIKPGIKFEFNIQNNQGYLSNTPIGAPNELLINTIDIGMLTQPRESFDFQENPEFNRQYSQTAPLYKLIVSRFEPVHLTKIVMPDGQIFTEMSSDNGSWHNGNMRETITKDLISNGLNLANYGINSSEPFADTFLPTAQITMHNSIGVYKNGIQVHGGSGGGGKATLEDTRGNELSHELGHNFGLGHYNGGFIRSVHATPEQPNSTWGWDADYSFFFPNFMKKKTNKPTYLGQEENEISHHEPYQGRKLNKDAMAGGSPYDPAYNSYTLYTPFVAAAIQKHLEQKLIFSTESATGFKKWNSTTSQMEDSTFDCFNFESLQVSSKNGDDIQEKDLEKLLNKNQFIHIKSGNGYHTPNINIPVADESNRNSIIKINSYAEYDSEIYVNKYSEKLKKNDEIYYISNGKSWDKHTEYQYNNKPDKQGIPVVTLIGYYDPENKIKSYIYDPLHGSYGMTYKPNDNISNSKVYLEVIYNNGTRSTHKLSGYRISKNMMNKFHINIERNREPVKTILFIDGKDVCSLDIEIKENKTFTTINGVIQ